MKEFLERWYGDSCPFWTWPATVVGFGTFFGGALWIISMIDQAECEKKGGNTVKDRACYHVTMKKID